MSRQTRRQHLQNLHQACSSKRAGCCAVYNMILQIIRVCVQHDNAYCKLREASMLRQGVRSLAVISRLGLVPSPPPHPQAQARSSSIVSRTSEQAHKHKSTQAQAQSTSIVRRTSEQRSARKAEPWTDLQGGQHSIIMPL